MASSVVSRLAGDGSVEVWLRGWYVRFPADNGEPSVSEGAAPNPPPPNTYAELKVSSFDSATFVRHGGWVVEFRNSNFTVTSVQPKEDDDDGGIYYILE